MNIDIENKEIKTKTFDYSEYLTQREIRREKDKEEANKDIKKILTKLKKKKIKTIMIDFWGGGDNGSIESITCFPDYLLDTDELTTEISDWAYLLLDTFETDWYNNEGGNGYIKILVDEKTYSHQVNYNTIVSILGEEGTVKI